MYKTFIIIGCICLVFLIVNCVVVSMNPTVHVNYRKIFTSLCLSILMIVLIEMCFFFLVQRQLKTTSGTMLLDQMSLTLKDLLGSTNI